MYWVIQKEPLCTRQGLPPIATDLVPRWRLNDWIVVPLWERSFISKVIKICSPFICHVYTILQEQEYTKENQPCAHATSHNLNLASSYLFALHIYCDVVGNTQWLLCVSLCSRLHFTLYSTQLRQDDWGMFSIASCELTEGFFVTLEVLDSRTCSLGYCGGAWVRSHLCMWGLITFAPKGGLGKL